MEGETCAICVKNLKGVKYHLFEKDKFTKKCLSYKISQISGTDLIQSEDGTFSCSDCYLLIVDILRLEHKFTLKFHKVKENNPDFSSSNLM